MKEFLKYLMLGEALSDSTRLLWPQVQRQELLLAVGLPQCSLLLLRDDSEHPGNGKPHHLTAAKIGTE